MFILQLFQQYLSYLGPCEQKDYIFVSLSSNNDKKQLKITYLYIYCLAIQSEYCW